MNDEIKEISYKLDSISNGAYNNDGYVDLKQDEAHLLLDYITNLQQENERLKEKSINEVLRNDFDMCVKDLKKANKKIEKLEDYKSRIEKALTYLEKVE